MENLHIKHVAGGEIITEKKNLNELNCLPGKKSRRDANRRQLHELR